MHFSIGAKTTGTASNSVFIIFFQEIYIILRRRHFIAQYTRKIDKRRDDISLYTTHSFDSLSHLDVRHFEKSHE